MRLMSEGIVVACVLFSSFLLFSCLGGFLFAFSSLGVWGMDAFRSWDVDHGPGGLGNQF